MKAIKAGKKGGGCYIYCGDTWGIVQTCFGPQGICDNGGWYCIGDCY